MTNPEYMIEIVTKKNAKLMKRFRVFDMDSAIKVSELYLNTHPKYDAHIHLKLGKGGYVREKVIKGGN
jgi:hypothetical protein